MVSKKGCSICGDDVYRKGYCVKHFTRYQRHGDPHHVRKNRASLAEIHNEESRLVLFDNCGTVTHVCKIDPEDIIHVNQETWVYNFHSKIITTANGRFSLTRYILKLPKNILKNKGVFFKNEDRLDYRKTNLQLIPLALCKTYMPKHKKYRGVYAHDSGRFYAKIFKDKKCYYLGIHPTEDEAALAYNAKGRELYGDLFLCNNIEDTVDN